MKSAILLAFTLACLIPVAHADCPTTGFEDIPYSTPTADFDLDDVNGVATHLPTGLMWKRCLEGQTWNAGVCDGTVTLYNWSAALSQAVGSTYADHNDWRLPNLKELRSIVEARCHDPSINGTVFPQTPSSGVWSGSPYTGNAGNAWYVTFYTGGAYNGFKNNNNRVRLVRGGQ